jgi:hypothetical protein
MHVPPLHVSVCVQNAPSSHGDVSLAFCASQAPVPALQTPDLQGALRLEQSFGVPPQAPAVHWSPVVHALPSLHVVPLSRGTAAQLPVWVLHVPTLHALSRLEQSTGLPPHVPPVHWSPVVQRLPSLHVVPLVTARFAQLPF